MSSTLPPETATLPEINIPDFGKLPEYYFDAQKGEFLASNNRSGWMSVSEGAMRRRLRGLGLSTAVDKDKFLSQVDVALQEVVDRNNLDHYGPLAGWAAGVHDILGSRVLVTAAPRYIKAKKGPHNHLDALLTGMLDDEGLSQTPYFLGWLKVALESLHAGIFRPGQALVLAGPRKCGKSLLQNLITEMVGGPPAKPYQFMTQATQFNGELFDSVHQMIEDEASSHDLRSRRNFGSYIKQFTSAVTQRCHPKGRQPIMLTPFWRLTISVNDEPENLMVLPPIDESLEDKIILLRAFSTAMPMPVTTLAEHQAFWTTLTGELPGFIYWLLHEWKIPAELQGERFGVTHFHHPELLRAISDLAPESKLLILIDEIVFGVDKLTGNEWEGSAVELQRELEENASRKKEVGDLLNYNTACGVFLARLSHRHRDRFGEGKTVHGTKIWTLLAPQRTDHENHD